MENSIIQNIDQKMVKTIDALKKDFVSIKAGRANPNILDNIFVDYYGSSMPINQLANITTPDSQLLVIVPWEKAATKEIEKSIIKANYWDHPTKMEPAPKSRTAAPKEISSQVIKVAMLVRMIAR